MSKLIKKSDGSHTLYIHRDELIAPLSDNVADFEADQQRRLVACAITGKRYVDTCSKCKHRIILHCPECQQQETGCSCTLTNKINAIKEESYNRLFE